MPDAIAAGQGRRRAEGAPRDAASRRRACRSSTCDAYVEDFGRSVVPGLPSRRRRRGAAGRRRPRPQRSSRPARRRRATSAASRRASREFLLEQCVGCMACVSACPDTAILAMRRAGVARSQPRDRRRSPPSQPEPAVAATDRPRALRRDPEVRRRAGAQARPRARRVRASSSTRSTARAARECVEVCAALGHDALVMIDKVADEPTRREHARALRARHARSSARCRRRRPSTATRRRWPTCMLGEHAIGYVGGAGSCAGCGEATAIRMLVAATRQVHGPESMGIVAATGCNTVFGSTYPFNPYLVPWTNSLFENAPAVALGHPRPLGPGRPPRAAAVGHRRRRRDVRHRLPGAVADGRVGRRHQGPRPRHAGLLEHRRPGLDRVVRRPGDEAVGVRQGAPRPARARARSSAGS